MSADFVIIDFETQSACDLKKTGAEKYAQDPSTRVLCLAYAWPEGPVHLWRPGEPIPQDFAAHVDAGRPVVAHNAPFELAIWNSVPDMRGFPPLEIHQTDCTMARALAMGLPAALGQCAPALRLPVEKDDEGHRIMMKLARPRRVSTAERIRMNVLLGADTTTEICKAVIQSNSVFWTPDDAPEDFARLYAYCRQDVLVERELHRILPPLPPKERALWELDRKINNRGVPVDVATAARALEIVGEEHKAFSRRIAELTGGAVPTANARDKLLAWFNSRGVQLAGLKKADVAAILAADDEDEPGEDVGGALDNTEGDEYPAKLPADVRAVLEIRREAAKASTAKFKAMINSTCANGRALGLFQYWGAGPGRWAGRRIQTQNMPRTPKHWKAADAEGAIAWLEYAGARSILRAAYGSVMDALSWCLRSLISAPAGRKFVCADYSNIEGRVIAFLAGEEWKLEAFKAYDTIVGYDEAGEPIRLGPDLYIKAVAEMYGIPIEAVTPEQRQAEGKVSELALGYQGGVGAFISMAAGYGIDLEKLAAAVKAAVAPDLWDKTALKLPRDGSRWRYGLAADTWIGVRVIVDSWRAANPNIQKFWYMLDEAACGAVEQPGVAHWAGPHIAFKVVGDFLLCKLPSGRCLSYPYPEMRLYPSAKTEGEIDDLKAEALELEHAEADAKAAGKPIDLGYILARNGEIIRALAQINTEIYCELKGEPLKGAKKRCEMRLRYWGLNSKNKWTPQRLYGGLLAENVTQATARDVLAEALPRCEAAGYPVVMHVHDEILCEVPDDGKFSETELAHIMCAVEPWARGLPIAAAGWQGARYRK